jgi:TolB-like protein/tetratricopeptide (TPR) repeat protein
MIVSRCLAKDRVERPASTSEVLAALDAALTSGEQPVHAPVSTRSRRRRVAPLALAVVVIAVFAVSMWAWRTRTSTEAPPLVAVLPFETLGGAAGATPDTAFADGLGDAITGKLARLQGLRVIDRASVRSVEDAARRPQAAGRELRADYVLRATLRWARGADGQARVQVSPVLVRVADGTTKWAGEPTVVAPTDPFAAQGAIAAAVAEALDVALAPTERARLARPVTTDTAAFAAVERGRRLWTRGVNGTPRDQETALREFERAYQRDPRYADALGSAANALQWMAQNGAPHALYDSAAALARRALAIDPGQVDAVRALSIFELNGGRVDDAIQVIERATRSFPSSAPLQVLLGSALQEFGDSARAVDAVTRAVALGPRSLDVLLDGALTMRRLRRYDDARDLLARARAVEPEAFRVYLATAFLARALGDTAGVSAAVRAARDAGALRGVDVLDLMRFGDAALQRELAAVSLASLGATTATDSVAYYRVMAKLLLAHGDAARAREQIDSGLRVSASHEADHPASELDGALMSRRVAWFAAGRGDRPAAVAALQRGATDPLVRLSGSMQDADQTCSSAEVYGLLGDAEAMLPFLRRCLTMPNGYHVPWLGEPAFARLRALAAEIAAAQVRGRSTTVGAAP